MPQIKMLQIRRCPQCWQLLKSISTPRASTEKRVNGSVTEPVVNGRLLVTLLNKLQVSLGLKLWRRKHVVGEPAAWGGLLQMRHLGPLAGPAASGSAFEQTSS